ncbi:XRE family transcriptional regulator [Streptomyces sp. TRM76323]|uniref:XRE family transcriptional regulator n=1 Tax=Streptomyces tamarix TaxID=3078565 RepID=A0ABU3QLC8_9ACTN|nr:XRE family transcriptional regulator [Streptomyces tamarix]MDT9683571.1 XRE family transcriptional regulator [Streptomyces tamarix]
MAEALGVDLGTVQGWESGRRPLGNMKAAALLRLRRRLGAMGAAPGVLGLLDPAMDADQVIGAALDPPESADLHPLATWVHTRETAHMLAWALTGVTPSALAGRVPASRRGPSAAAPLLGASDRAQIFDHLRETAEAARRPGEALLCRQALYLASYDRSSGAVSWTAHALHGRRGNLTRRGWSEHWAQARSTATALARLGDPQPLLDFIERSLAGDDTAEAANLNYWAYWLGGVRLPQSDDRFMQERELTAWDPLTLLRGLTYGLHHAPGYLDLYAHTLWALLTARPWLPQASQVLAADLRTRTEDLLDGDRITARSRRELTTVHYVLRERT